MVEQAPTNECMRALIEQLRDGEPLDTAVNSGTRFIADLGLSSMELIGLVFLCEQTFQVDLVNSGTPLADLRTVGQAVDRIQSLQQRRCA
jgi:acyl carrier protein